MLIIAIIFIRNDANMHHKLSNILQLKAIGSTRTLFTRLVHYLYIEGNQTKNYFYSDESDK